MLKGLDPLLTPDLLRTLQAMGHGDEIVIVDANYPAESGKPPVIRLAGATASEAANAILSVMPLDEFVPEAAWRMEVVGAPDEEQLAFYARAGQAFATVATGELRLYGNLILKKGVVRPT